MSAVSLRLPESLHKQIRKLAKAESISVNQFLATAAAEKMSALMTERYLEERASRGSKAKFLRALSRIPDVEPEEADRIPPEMQRSRRR